MGKLLQMSLLFEALLDAETPDGTAQLSEAPMLAPNVVQPPANLVADAAERESALNIRRSWIVEAPAGSGKTGLLIQRFLKLLAHGEVERPDEILAITFTRKADAEMRRRVLEQLAAAHARAPLPPDAGEFQVITRQLAEAALARDQALNWNLLQSPQQLNIRTIDSFCAELAGSMPLLAGPGGRYSPTDDPAPLYDIAAERTLLHMGGSDPVLTRDLEDLLYHRDAQPSDFKRLLADMLRERHQWGELVPLDTAKLTEQALDEQVRPRLVRTLHRLIEQDLAQISDAVGPALLDRLAQLAHTLSTCPGSHGACSPLAFCEGRPQAPGTSAEDLEHWLCLGNLVLTSGGTWRSGFNKRHLGFETNSDEQEQLRTLVDAFKEREADQPNLRQRLCGLNDLPDPKYPDEQWQTVKSLCRVLRQALLELQVIFAERRSCDFTEVALNARSLIRSESTTADLLNTSVARFRHLLVDEMQDTSAGQYELLESITASWDGATQTLFLVGDPKQSIYEFRQARVERFRRVMEIGRFGHLTVGALRLTANFRSQATLVEAFNDTFGQILPPLGDPSLTANSVDVPFIAATATRAAAIGPALHWHASEQLSSGSVYQEEQAFEDVDSEVAAPAEAEAIRSIIEEFLRTWSDRDVVHENNARAPRIAVLARNRAHLAPIIHEFHQDHGAGPLAFRAVDVEALHERREILDLLALTRALLHPADRVAWLAVLRSPMCGLDLTDLLTLTGDGHEADPDVPVTHLIATRHHLLTAEAQQHLLRAWATLSEALRTLGRTPLATHVERTWRSLGGDAPLQSHELANAHRFLDLLHSLEEGTEPFALSLLNRRLRTLYAEPNSPDAPVELMTIHKAKGLEWDLVLIPALHRGSGRNTHEFLKWLEFDTEEGTPEFLLAPIQSKGEDTSKLSRWLNRRQQQREIAEAKRLFYVACTRAREQLHLFATIERNRDGSLRMPKQTSSLLRAAWPAAEPFFQSQPAPASSTEVSATTMVPFAMPRRPKETLAFAAAEDPGKASSNLSEAGREPIRRLPFAFDPLARYTAEGPFSLAYPDTSTLRREATFTRPDGSFAARAFGNAVHRFLHVLSNRTAAGQSVNELTTELSSWHARVLATLRSEGLSPFQAAADTGRVLQALKMTLEDPEGAWLLAPHAFARSEATVATPGSPTRVALRADRTFYAGSAPLSSAEPTHLWIIDYKTAELGGRSRQIFLASQQRNYAPQMQAYAQVAIAAGQAPERLRLALYFPLLPALIWWPATNEGTQS